VDPADETPARLAELRLRADAEAWAAVGFVVEGAEMRLGSVPVRFGAGHGWTLSGPASTEFDGLPTELGDPPPEMSSVEHPNGALSIDHLVVFTPDLGRTVAAFEANRVRCRRIREVGPPEGRLRQAFFRFGEVICEVVEVPAEQAGPDGAARFWGLTVVVADLDGLVAELGSLCGRARDAVQPGRRIATLRREAGLGLPVALITPKGKGPDAGGDGGGAEPPPRLPPVRRPS
jgi:hypothetical protein